MLERLVMLMLSFSACIICYLSGKLRISGKSGLTNRMSFDYGEGKTIINSLQTLFASMALSPNAVCDPSPIFSVLNLKTNEMGDCFQFLTTVMVAFKDFLNLLGKASLFSSLTNVFTGLHKVCRCCLRCHRVFYSEDTFDHIECQIRNNCRLEDTLAQEFQRINDTQADFLCPL